MKTSLKGAQETTRATAPNTSLNDIMLYQKYFAIIPFSLGCTIRAKFPVTGLDGTVLKKNKELKIQYRLLSLSSKPENLVI